MAEQISAVLVLPVLLVLFGQVAGFIVLNVATVVGYCIVIALIDIGMIFLGVRLFQRETILTRWK